MHIDLSKAIAHLNTGVIVAIPTETVYGLAAPLFLENSVKQIFTLKKRPPSNPLIVHIADRAQAEPLIDQIPPHFDTLADAFWPGPVTLVVPASPHVPEIVRAGLPTVALRIPGHPLARALLKETGPLVAPSANLSGRPSSTRPRHVEDDFGLEFPVLDGGPCQKGIESTILINKDNEWQIGRLGALSINEIEAVLGYPVKSASAERPLCPGQHFRHYSPKAKLQIAECALEISGVVVGFSDRLYPKAARVIPLGPLSDPAALSQNLYRTLRALDEEGIEEAHIDFDFPKEGHLLTISERLLKAAARHSSGAGGAGGNSSGNASLRDSVNSDSSASKEIF